MNKFSIIILFISSITFIGISEASQENAENNVLTPDESIIGGDLIEFPNDSRIYPDKSDFKILNSIIMSNLKGERWATITVTNQAQGKRTLNQDQVLALFADGTRRFPLTFTQEFKSEQTVSLIINFGTNKFPILKIMTRDKKD